jgi:hypothetical protein
MLLPLQTHGAAALAANAVGGDVEGECVDAPSRIRDHLKAKRVDALVAMIMDLAGQDLGLLCNLGMAAAALHEGGKKLEARLQRDRRRDAHQGFAGYRSAAG